MMDEKSIIDLIIKTLGHPPSPISKIGDDVAVIPSKNNSLVITSDMLVYETDVPPGMKLSQVARKSIAMSVSDLSSKGVVPEGVLISLGLMPTLKRSEIESLLRGFHSAIKDFGVKVVGGDVNETSDLVISCTMFGFSDKIVKRSGAHPGEIVVVSGPFGYPASGLKILLENAQAKDPFRRRALRSLYLPTPPSALGIKLHRSEIPTSSIDSSDGLAISLHEISEQSEVSIKINHNPSTKEINQFAKSNRIDVKDLVFYGGEEYETVWTIPEKKFSSANQIANKMGKRLIKIGSTFSESSSSVYFTNGNVDMNIEKRGWNHFG